jgi:NTE family protein
VQEKKQKIGLALSGGGYRAAAFHLGVFRKLDAMGILSRINVISTISGGSIAGAFYLLNKDNFDLFEKKFTDGLKKSVIKRIILSVEFLLPIILLFAILGILVFDPFDFSFRRWQIVLILVTVLTLVVVFQFKILSFTRLKIRAYKDIFYGRKTICDFPDQPVLAINATNLSTGTLFTFSKKKSSDSSYEYPKDNGAKITFKCSDMPIAMAVASSTSVPIPFDPVLIPEKYYENKSDYKRVKPQLIDGGLYDNQGIHKITQRNSSYACDIIIVSDGSQPFGNKFKAWNSGFILYRGIDVMMRKIKNLQFIRDVFGAEREVAYFSLDWQYRRSITEFVRGIRSGFIPESTLKHHGITEEILNASDALVVDFVSNKVDLDSIASAGLTIEEIQSISAIGTNLTALTDHQIKLLSKHGEILCELHLKLYCPALINNN